MAKKVIERRVALVEIDPDSGKESVLKQWRAGYAPKSEKVPFLRIAYSKENIAVMRTMGAADWRILMALGKVMNPENQIDNIHGMLFIYLKDTWYKDKTEAGIRSVVSVSLRKLKRLGVIKNIGRWSVMVNPFLISKNSIRDNIELERLWEGMPRG